MAGHGCRRDYTTTAVIFSATSDQLDPERRTHGPRAIDSFLVRRTVCRLTTKDYNRLTLDLAEMLQQRGIEEADDVIIDFLQEQTTKSPV